MKEESDITFVRFFLRGLIGPRESFDPIFVPRPPPMYMYRHDWISIDIYELVVTWLVTWLVLIGRNQL